MDYDTRIRDLERQLAALSERVHASNEAIGVARAATDKRFDSVNEFRGQLSDQQKTLVTRDALDSFSREYRSAHEALSQQVSANASRLANIEGRMLAYGGIVTVVSLALTVILHFWKSIV